MTEVLPDPKYLQENKEVTDQVRELEAEPKPVWKPSPSKPIHKEEKKQDDSNPIPNLSQVNVNRMFGVYRTDEFDSDYYGDGE